MVSKINLVTTQNLSKECVKRIYKSTNYTTVWEIYTSL